MTPICLAKNEPRTKPASGGRSTARAMLGESDELPGLDGLGEFNTCGLCGAEFRPRDKFFLDCDCGGYYHRDAPPRSPSPAQIAPAMRLLRTRRGLAVEEHP